MVSGLGLQAWTPGPEGGRGGWASGGLRLLEPCLELMLKAGKLWRITILKVCGGEDTPTCLSINELTDSSTLTMAGFITRTTVAGGGLLAPTRASGPGQHLTCEQV